jgi:hypothetical protein
LLDEISYKSNPVHQGVNSIPGIDLLEKYEKELEFIEKSPSLIETQKHIPWQRR